MANDQPVGHGFSRRRSKPAHLSSVENPIPRGGGSTWWARLRQAIAGWLPPLSVIALLAWRYATTMPPGMSSLQMGGWTDSAAMQVVGSYWGIAHSPGYPLYTVLSNLFVRLVGLLAPATEPAWRVSFFSLCHGLLALFLLALLARRLGVSPLLSAAAVAVLGTAPSFWRFTVTAEVYTLNLVLVLLGLWLALAWLEAPVEKWHLLALGLTSGALAAHHRTGLFLVLILIPWLLLARRATWRARATRLLVVAAAALPMLLFYAYLPLAALLNKGYTRLYAEANRPAVFWHIVLSREWWGLVDRPADLAELVSALAQVAVQQSQELGAAVLLVLGFIGLALAGKRSLLLGALAAGFVLFGALYSVSDLSSMLIPLTALLSLGLALLAQRLASLAGRLLGSEWGQRALVAVFSLLLFVTPARAVLQPPVDESTDTVGIDYVEAIQGLAEDGVPITILAEANTPLAAVQYARARHKLADLEPLSATQLAGLYPSGREPNQVEADRADAAVRAALEQRWRQGRSIYLSSEVVQLEMIPEISRGIAERRYLLAPTTYPDLQLLLPSAGLPPLARPPQHALTSPNSQGLQLVGYDQRWIRKRSGIHLRLAFYWQVSSPVDQDIVLQLRPGGPLSDALQSSDHHNLLQGAYAPGQLSPGDTLRDVYELRLNTLPPSQEPAGLQLTYQSAGQPSVEPASVTIPVEPLPPEWLR